MHWAWRCRSTWKWESTTGLRFPNSPKSLTTVIHRLPPFVMLAEQEMFGFALSFQWAAVSVLVVQREWLA
jgi:hypothetical protein